MRLPEIPLHTLVRGGGGQKESGGPGGFAGPGRVLRGGGRLRCARCCRPYLLPAESQINISQEWVYQCRIIQDLRRDLALVSGKFSIICEPEGETGRSQVRPEPRQGAAQGLPASATGYPRTARGGGVSPGSSAFPSSPTGSAAPPAPRSGSTP